MRIGLFSDLHLHTWTCFGVDTETGLSRRLKDQSDVLSQIVRISKDKKIDRWEFGGDWIHKVGEVPIEVLNVLIRFLVTLKEPIESTPGNHGMIERGDPKWFQIFANMLGTIQGSVLVGGEWSAEYKKESDYDGFKVRRVGYHERVAYSKIRGYDLVILHKTPAGARVGNYTFDEGVDWRALAKTNGVVVFGHIHQKQVFAENCFVIGSPLHLTFGDEGERGIWIVEDGKTEFVKLEYPEFRSVQTVQEARDDKHYYRVLSSKEKSDKENVVCVVEPEFFEERIKANDFLGILKEWLVLHSKEEGYLREIDDIITDKMQLHQALFSGVLTKVKMFDFMSIGDVEYEVSKGFTLVDGWNKETNGSNGSGKTSGVGEVIFWGLFGKTTKGLTGTDVIRRGRKDCYVELHLSGKKGSYVVKRSVVNGLSVVVDDGNGEVDLFGKMKKLDRQKAFEEQVLGFNSQLFLSACYFSQESLSMLTSMSDVEKTSMITSLLGFETYDDLYQAVVDKIKGIESMVSDLDKDVSGIDKDLEIKNVRLEGCRDKIRGLQEEIEGVREALLKSKAEVRELKVSRDSLVGVQEGWEDFDDVLKDLYDMESQLGDKSDKIYDELEKVKEACSKIEKEEINLESDIKHLFRDVDKITDKVKQIESQDEGAVCDACGSVIKKENIRAYIAGKHTEMNGLSLKIGLEENRLKDLRVRKCMADKEVGEVSGRLDSIKAKVLKVRGEIGSTNKDKGVQDKEKNKVQEQQSEIDKDISSVEAEIRVRENRVEEAKVKFDEWEKDKDVIASEIVQCRGKKKEIESQMGKMVQSIDVLEFWKMTFSSKGVRTLLLDRFCNEYNGAINYYLAVASNGSMSMVVTPTKQLKGGEERNKLGMEIRMGSDVVKYESLSGGEKRRVDIALCMGLGRWFSQKYELEGGLLGMIILDELFSYIDRTGEEAIGTLLYHEGVNKAELVITHTPDLDSYADRYWRFVKEGGVSHLEIGGNSEQAL